MDFEWDPNKSAFNKKKHGISFKEATEIWQGPHFTANSLARSNDGEERGGTIGLIKGDVYTAIWTKRKKKVRLISVRRSRDGEKEIFWKKIV